MTERKKVSVCLPCYGNISSVWFQQFIKTLSEWLNDPGLEVGVLMNSVTPIDKSRCELVKEALNKRADYVFMVDSDVLIPENALQDMIKVLDSHEKAGAVSGVYFTKGAPFNPVLRVEQDGRFFFYDDPLPEEPFKVDGTGSGCLLIKAGVFNKIEFPLGNYYYLVVKRGVI